ncbi:MAG: hypothetical protein IT340_21705 [Chloroflexi bacterium]|nr:hypothetical protein [Chloroflexota bacterium]
MARSSIAALVAGVLAGLAGLLVFLVLHALWIMPIWFILPLGVVIAGLGGMAVGWAYAELRHRLPARPWTALATVGLIAVILLPAVVLAELRPPLFVVTVAGAVATEPVPSLIARFAGELLLTATVTGALLGWWLGGTRRAVVATAVAGFCFALGPGHNIPLVGATPGVAKELAIMGTVIGIAALVLVEGHAWLATRTWWRTGAVATPGLTGVASTRQRQ